MIVVVDANELFAALISRRRTLDLFFISSLEFVSPNFIIEEFEKHKKEIVNKSKLTSEEVDYFRMLISSKIKFYDVEEYSDFLPVAKKISPDPNDEDYFALALKLNAPIWSQDKKLKEQKEVKVYNTKEILEII